MFIVADILLFPIPSHQEKSWEQVLLQLHGGRSNILRSKVETKRNFGVQNAFAVNCCLTYNGYLHLAIFMEE